VITPSKAVNIRESALGQATILLEAGGGRRDLLSLYWEVGRHFAGVDDFMLALDLLYVLGRVDVDVPTRVMSYAD